MFRVIAKVIAQNAALGVFQAVGKRDIPPDMIDINRKAQIGRPDLGADRQRIADGPAACVAFQAACRGLKRAVVVSQA